MTSMVDQHTIFIILTVILFVLLAVVMLILIDHKSKIPGHFKNDPFSISGIRNEHPVIAFVVSSFLGLIIFGLLLEMVVVLGAHFGFTGNLVEDSVLLTEIKQARKDENIRHFHNLPDIELVDLGKKTVCFQCHGDYPHSQIKMIRSLLNMHTQFLGCMTCHIDPLKVPEENYQLDWLNYSGIPVTGPPFGTRHDPDTGYLVETDDLYSKIVIYDNRKFADEALLEITEDNLNARQFIEMKDSLSDLNRHAIKKRFHEFVMHKGRFCTRCHTDEENSYIPFRLLGFSEARIKDVTNINIVGIVEKYREFYMPSLFNAHTSLPGIKIMAGDEKEKIKVPENELLKERAWWRNTDDVEKNNQ